MTEEIKQPVQAKVPINADEVREKFKTFLDIVHDERFCVILDSELEGTVKERLSLKAGLAKDKRLRRTTFDRMHERGLTNSTFIKSEYLKISRNEVSGLPSVLRNYVVYIVSQVAKMTVNSYVRYE